MQVCSVGELRRALEGYPDDMMVSVTMAGVPAQLLRISEVTPVFANGRSREVPGNGLVLDVSTLPLADD